MIAVFPEKPRLTGRVIGDSPPASPSPGHAQSASRSTVIGPAGSLTKGEQLALTALVSEVQVTYLDPQKVEEILERMLAGRSLDDPAAINCEHKFRWMLREIAEIIQEFDAPDQKSLHSATILELRQMVRSAELRPLYARLVECWQAMEDIAAAAAGQNDSGVFTAGYATSKWPGVVRAEESLEELECSHEWMKALAVIKELERDGFTWRKLDELTCVISDLRSALYARDPESTLQLVDDAERIHDLIRRKLRLVHRDL